MTVEDMLAREGIRQTIARYTDAGDNGRYEDLIPCYAEDGIFEIASGQWHGRAAIEKALRTMRAARDATVKLQRHHLGTCHITLKGPEHAAAVTYFTVISDIGPDHAGRYLDDLVRRDGTWQFAHRNVMVEWRSDESRFLPGIPPAAA
ncbi:nuclear transport factor 2 family protein [uncultured Sphingomonas sp.]|uniref:nuclear transport factor 2 family protein n=1 Tax=uncultured Sphingomonas sp. TaxID=158754 RepID=UPI0035CB665F